MVQSQITQTTKEYWRQNHFSTSTDVFNLNTSSEVLAALLFPPQQLTASHLGNVNGTWKLSWPIHSSTFRLDHSSVSVWIRAKRESKWQHRKRQLSGQSVLEQCHSTVHWRVKCFTSTPCSRSRAGSSTKTTLSTDVAASSSSTVTPISWSWSFQSI